jgi:UPF0288 family protein (methanogenesis marker protein 3)
MYYVVTFAKVMIGKSGIEIHGTYFGGVSEEEDEASKIAHECVGRVKNGTTLVKIIHTDDKIIFNAMSDAIKKFEIIVSQMQEADKIINRTQSKNDMV